MIRCPTCNHPRLLHDSWGCKEKCNCGVSVIYMTPLFSSQTDRSDEVKLIEQGNLLVRQVDRRVESEIEEMQQRSLQNN